MYRWKFYSATAEVKYKSDCGNTEPKIIVVGRLDIKGKDQIRRVYDPDGLAPTLSTMQGGQQQPKVIIYD